MSDEPIHKYPGEAIDVSWDGRLCIHVGECGRSEGELFVSGRDPWCDPGKVQSVQDVVEVCERCPTGALTYIRKDGGPAELPPGRNRVVVSNDGPLYLTGDLSIDGAAEGMTGVRTRAALCRCGASKNKPFCDNSHREVDFHDAGAVGVRAAIGLIPRADARLGPPVAVSLGARSAPGTASASLLPTDGPRRTSAREIKPIAALR